MKKLLMVSVPALLCSLSFGASVRTAQAADLICHNGWSVYQCEGGDTFECFFNAGTPDAYQVNCSDYTGAFASSAEFFCHDKGGLANPPIVDTGPVCEPAEDESIRDEDEDQDIDEAPPRR